MSQWCRLAEVLVCAGILLGGCGGPKAKGPSDGELVSQVIDEWKAGWEGSDVERLMACVSPNFNLSDGGGPDAIRGFADGLFRQAGAKIEFVLEEMEISVKEEEASVSGIRAKIRGPDSESLYGLSIGLRKEGGKWLITWLETRGGEG